MATTTGTTAAEVRLAALAVRRRGHLTISEEYDGTVIFEDVTGPAELVTGLHLDSDDALTSLVQALQQAAEQAADEDERGRLHRAADGLTGHRREVLQDRHARRGDWCAGRRMQVGGRGA